MLHYTPHNLKTSSIILLSQQDSHSNTMTTIDLPPKPVPRTRRTKRNKPIWTKTREEALKEYQKDTPTLRAFLERVYDGTEAEKLEMDRIIDSYNKDVDLYNKKCDMLDQRDEQQFYQKLHEHQLALLKRMDRLRASMDEMLNSPLYR
jgi:hypothetical protein